ncbi:MAG: hypothetical protein LAP61_24990 [Acidobacteriia bacterium]|nr:hypothetical protein [Terriglobia bacterium]
MANLLWKTLARITAAFGLLAGSGAQAQGLSQMMLAARAVSATITRDNTANVMATTGVSSLTVSYTVGSGTNRALIVGVKSNGTTGPDFSSVTYSGVNMIILGTVYQAATTRPVTLLYLAAPASGANNLILNGLNTFSIYDVNVVSYTGATQTTPANIVSDNTTLSTSLTLSLTTAGKNSWMIGYFYNTSDDAISAGAGATILTQDSGAAQADSNGDVGAAGSHSMTVTGDVSIYGIMLELPHA